MDPNLLVALAAIGFGALIGAEATIRHARHRYRVRQRLGVAPRRSKILDA